MFAGAAREVVFSNPEVIRRVQESFIPVALKAGVVNRPPTGIEGQLYAEIARTRPAPQGICSTNSSGKVLTWALSFDDDLSILEFLEHVQERYRAAPTSSKRVTAERFMHFPSRPLSDVADNGRAFEIPSAHSQDDRCPGEFRVDRNTLVGKIIGRALDEEGEPLKETLRQEHYMEARFEVPADVQREVSRAAQQAGGEAFDLPEPLIRLLVTHTYLGQLDVNPMGAVPGSRNEEREWKFTGERIESEQADVVRVYLRGESNVAGAQDQVGRRTDGRLWEHRVTLSWEGYLDLQADRMQRLSIAARGTERLRWGNPRFQLTTEPDAQHLMAGHPIDLECGVRYAIFASP